MTEDKYNAGFTLVELLVVLAILSLVLAVSTPLLKPGSGRLDMKRSAMEVVSAIRLARSEAVTKNRETVFSIDVRSGEYWSSGQKKKALPNTISRTMLSAREERINESVGRFRFFPDGSSSGGSLILEYRQLRQNIAVDWLTGAVILK